MKEIITIEDAAGRTVMQYRVRDPYLAIHFTDGTACVLESVASNYGGELDKEAPTDVERVRDLFFETKDRLGLLDHTDHDEEDARLKAEQAAAAARERIRMGQEFERLRKILGK